MPLAGLPLGRAPPSPRPSDPRDSRSSPCRRAAVHAPGPGRAPRPALAHSIARAGPALPSARTGAALPPGSGPRPQRAPDWPGWRPLCRPSRGRIPIRPAQLPGAALPPGSGLWAKRSKIFAEATFCAPAGRAELLELGKPLQTADGPETWPRLASDSLGPSPPATLPAHNASTHDVADRPGAPRAVPTRVPAHAPARCLLPRPASCEYALGPHPPPVWLHSPSWQCRSPAVSSPWRGPAWPHGPRPALGGLCGGCGVSYHPSAGTHAPQQAGLRLLDWGCSCSDGHPPARALAALE